MRKAEQKVWDAMKRRAPKDFWLQRVENLAGEGMPDVYVSRLSGGPWVELKAAKLPKRATTKVMGDDGVRTSQRNWHMKAATKGIRSYILLRIDHPDHLRLPLLFHGTWADDINEWTYAELYGASVARGWIEIFEELK